MKNKAFPVKDKGAVHIHLVPYSEHSSYSELREYVRWLRPAQVLVQPQLDGTPANGSQRSHVCILFAWVPCRQSVSAGEDGELAHE